MKSPESFEIVAEDLSPGTTPEERRLREALPAWTAPSKDGDAIMLSSRQTLRHGP